MSTAHLHNAVPGSDDSTRRRLLEAAGEVFAELGFKAATIRDICERAGVNVSAVNYHFGDKEKLYREVFDFTAGEAFRKHSAAKLPHGASPEEELAVFIRVFMARLLDSGKPAWHGKLIAREMMEPTIVLDDIAGAYMRPQYNMLREILGRLIRAADVPVWESASMTALEASEERLRLCCNSIVGQCLFYKHCMPMIERLQPEQRFDERSRERLIDHIIDFSLRGLRPPRGWYPLERRPEGGVAGAKNEERTP